MKNRPPVVTLFDKNRWDSYKEHSHKPFNRETYQTLLYSDVAISVDYVNQTFTVIKNRYGHDNKIKNAPMNLMTTFIFDPELDTMEKLGKYGSNNTNTNTNNPQQTLFAWEAPH